jgi:hypothetical protein
VDFPTPPLYPVTVIIFCFMAGGFYRAILQSGKPDMQMSRCLYIQISVYLYICIPWYLCYCVTVYLYIGMSVYLYIQIDKKGFCIVRCKNENNNHPG